MLDYPGVALEDLCKVLEGGLLYFRDGGADCAVILAHHVLEFCLLVLHVLHIFFYEDQQVEQIVNAQVEVAEPAHVLEQGLLYLFEGVLAPEVDHGPSD